MSIVKKILLVLLFAFIIIQFFRPKKNLSAAASPNDIFAHYQTSENTKQLIRSACYDCHSNNTLYPWYAEIQPVAWWLNDHIEEGKSELNFSEFATYSSKKANKKMEEVEELVEEKEMPLKSYALIHENARLTDKQRTDIIDWAKQIRAQIQPGSREPENE